MGGGPLTQICTVIARSKRVTSFAGFPETLRATSILIFRHIPPRPLVDTAKMEANRPGPRVFLLRSHPRPSRAGAARSVRFHGESKWKETTSPGVHARTNPPPCVVVHQWPPFLRNDAVHGTNNPGREPFLAGQSRRKPARREADEVYTLPNNTDKREATPFLAWGLHVQSTVQH